MKEEEGRIEIIVGAQDVVDRVIASLSKISEKLDCCYDSAGPLTIVSIEPLFNAGIDFVKRGGKLRLITEITYANISACREIMKFAEVRHMDGVKGNFGVSERDYYSFIISKEEQPMTPTIYNDVKEYVQFQQFLFDTMWKETIPADERIREIEDGINKREILEVITEPVEILSIANKLIDSAHSELLLLFSTPDAFYFFERAGIVERLENAIKEKGTHARILISSNHDEEIEKIIEAKKRNDILPAEIRDTKKQFEQNVTIFLRDKSVSLAIETKHHDGIRSDSKKETLTYGESIGSATYSNNESTMLSYSTIFENLWIESNRHHIQ